VLVVRIATGLCEHGRGEQRANPVGALGLGRRAQVEAAAAVALARRRAARR